MDRGAVEKRKDASATLIQFNDARSQRQPEIVGFARRELDQLLRLCSMMVAANEAATMPPILADRAVFSVYP